jgi:hypothetical protein
VNHYHSTDIQRPDKACLCIQEGLRKETITMGEEKEKLKKILENVKQSGRLVLEHYKSRGFKNTLIEVGLNNIIGMTETAIEMIEKNQAKETQ